MASSLPAWPAVAPRPVAIAPAPAADASRAEAQAPAPGEEGAAAEGVERGVGHGGPPAVYAPAAPTSPEVSGEGPLSELELFPDHRPPPDLSAIDLEEHVDNRFAREAASGEG